MRGRLELVIAIITFANVILILEMVRRRQLREKYALLWLGVGIVAMFLSVARSWLDWLAHNLGISYGPSGLFLFSTLFLMAVAAHLSWEVSRLEERTRRLAEEVAIMRAEPPTGQTELGNRATREPEHAERATGQPEVAE